MSKLGNVLVRAEEGECEGERNMAGEMEWLGTKRYADGSVYEGERGTVECILDGFEAGRGRDAGMSACIQVLHLHLQCSPCTCTCNEDMPIDDPPAPGRLSL